MSLIQDYIADKLLSMQHPVLDERRCIDHIQNRFPCSGCRDICPSGVFRRGFADWDRCTGCLLCISSCPAGCISLPGTDLRQWLSVLKSRQQTVTIACAFSGQKADLLVSCLHAIPWEYLALLTVFHHITIFFEGCDLCNFPQDLPLFLHTLERTKVFLGEDIYAEAVTLTDQPLAADSHAISRRGFFKLAFSKTTAAAYDLLPQKADAGPAGLWRRLLAAACGSDREQTFGWMAPQFLEGCNACGICEKTCPAQAVYRVRDDDDPSVFHMAVFPAKCAECGLCQKMCPYDGITSPVLHKTALPGRPLLHTVGCRICQKCGEPILSPDAAGDVCLKCAASEDRSLSSFWS